MNKEEAIKRWEFSVRKISEDIDPSNTHDWLSLCYGYMLGLGLTIDEANECVGECFERDLL